MAGFVSVTILNDKKLVRALEKLPDKFYKRTVKSAAVKGGAVLRKEVKRRAPVSKPDQYDLDRGRRILKSSIKAKTVKFLKDGVWHTLVSPDKNPKKKGGKKSRGPGTLVHLLEFGHRIAPRIKGARLKRIITARTDSSGRRRVERQKGPFTKSVGFVAPRPFEVPGTKAAQPEVLRVIKATLKKGVAKANIDIAKGMK